MSTKTKPGPFDAFEKALPGEPIFTLLGRDPSAPATITEWARLRRNRAIRLYGDNGRESDQALLRAEMVQCAQAEAVALAFGEYRSGADPVEGENATYQDVVRSEAEIAAAEALKQRETACRHLREAAYHLAEARAVLHLIEAIEPGGFYDTSLKLAERETNGAATHFEAKRPASEAA